MTAKELSFITVIGMDQKGIVAKISGKLYELGINILDINQKVMEDYFVMNMLVDLQDCQPPLEEVSGVLEKLGEQLKLKIQIQHENIFKSMHRI
jgi:ACT domain-containing protein